MWVLASIRLPPPPHCLLPRCHPQLWTSFHGFYFPLLQSTLHICCRNAVKVQSRLCACPSLSLPRPLHSEENLDPSPWQKSPVWSSCCSSSLRMQSFPTSGSHFPLFFKRYLSVTRTPFAAISQHHCSVITMETVSLCHRLEFLTGGASHFL